MRVAVVMANLGKTTGSVIVLAADDDCRTIYGENNNVWAIRMPEKMIFGHCCTLGEIVGGGEMKSADGGGMKSTMTEGMLCMKNGSHAKGENGREGGSFKTGVVINKVDG